MTSSIIYTRVSSREQQQEGFSLGAQAKTLREYADRGHFNVIKTFEDVETAKTSGRKQFNEMVKWLKQNPSCRTLLVEKTDRLYRNLRDAVTLEDLDIEVHLVKEGQIVSKDSKSQTKLIHGINLVLARNYSENLKEEVKKGMREKAAQGGYPGHAPFGYRNNKAERTIEIDPVDAPMVIRLMELYATGAHTLSTLCKVLKTEFDKTMSRGNIHLILKNRFYIGCFEWAGETHRGTHQLFIDAKTFQRVQDVLAGHNRPKHSKREIAFRGLMNCAHDGCMLTGDVQKEKYIYYRCTGNRGKCDLPRFREEVLSDRLGEPLKGLQVPPQIVAQIVDTLREDRKHEECKLSAERTRLDSRLTTIRNRMDAAYADKLDGKIPEDFWERKMSEWRAEEQQVKMVIDGLATAETGDRALDAQKVFELANKAYSLYFSRDSTERAKLLRMICSNFSVDAASVIPTYRYPFNLIFKRAELEEWSGREDSNLRPPGPEPGALPDCATPRIYCGEMSMSGAFRKTQARGKACWIAVPTEIV
jgi:site-specific DNA recombinase